MKFILNEGANSIIQGLSQAFTMSDSPVMGPSYIFPDGRFIVIPEPEEMGAGVFVSYRCHSLLHLWLVSKKLTKKTIWDINGMTDILDAGAIKVNLGPIPDEEALLNYIELPKKAPTSSQYDALISWLDLAQSKGIYEIEVDTYNQGRYKSYSLKENTSDEVVSKIKRYYASGTLYEDIKTYEDDLFEGYLDDKEEYWDYGTEVITNDKDIVSTKTTGVSYYNQFLHKSDAEYLRDKENLTGEIRMMSPSEYYEDCSKYAWPHSVVPVERLKATRAADKVTLQKLKNVLQVYKRKLCLPMLNYATGGQEGLHRMYVIGELYGWDFKVPVLTIHYADKERADRETRQRLEKSIYDCIEKAVNNALFISYECTEDFEAQLQLELDRAFKYLPDVEKPVQFTLKIDGQDYTLIVQGVEYEFDENDVMWELIENKKMSTIKFKLHESIDPSIRKALYELNSLPVMNGWRAVKYELIKDYERVLKTFPVGSVLSHEMDAGVEKFTKTEDGWWDHLRAPWKNINVCSDFDLAHWIAARGYISRGPIKMENIPQVIDEAISNSSEHKYYLCGNYGLVGTPYPHPVTRQEAEKKLASGHLLRSWGYVHEMFTFDDGIRREVSGSPKLLTSPEDFDAFEAKLESRSTVNEELLTEDIAAVKKNYPNISDDDFYRLIRLDPTFVEGKDIVGTYGKWILNLFNKGNLDNEGHVFDILTRFEENKKNLKDKDIGKFKTLAELDEYLDNDDNYKTLSHRQEVRQRQNDRKNADLGNEAEKVFENSDWEVWIPKTYAASCKLGQGSSWCTASTESDYYYRYYTSQGNLYINLNKHDENDKYQFHFESSSFMDIDDRSIDLAEFLGDNEGLHEFYYPIIASSLGIDLSKDEIRFELSDMEVYELFKEYDNHANRNAVSGDFIYKLISGDAWSAFELWDYSPDINWAYLPDLDENCLEELKRLGLTEEQFRDVTDGSFDGDNFDEDFAEELVSCVKRAMVCAEETGAEIEAMEDLVSSIKDASGGGVVFDYSPFSMSADPKALMRIYLGDLDGDLSQTGEPITTDKPAMNIMAYVFCENFSFYEPQYGWNGFDDETFLERLAEYLYEIEIPGDGQLSMDV